jgi:hypothetical protein
MHVEENTELGCVCFEGLGLVHGDYEVFIAKIMLCPTSVETLMILPLDNIVFSISWFCGCDRCGCHGLQAPLLAQFIVVEVSSHSAVKSSLCAAVCRWDGSGPVKPALEI